MLDFCALRHLLIDLQNVQYSLEKESGLTFQQASVLCALKQGYQDGTTLAREMKLSPSRMTRIIDSVVEKGLVTRTESKKDRRTLILSLTLSGGQRLELLEKSDVAFPEYIERMLCKEFGGKHV
ncbi:MAG: MarR family transcriptional regulator [Sphaerochaetaceae bacterium]